MFGSKIVVLEKLLGRDALLKCTVSGQTHVLCKPTHFIFQLLIDTMFSSLQTSFSSVMTDLFNEYPLKVIFKVKFVIIKTSVFHNSVELIDLCSNRISVVIILCFKGFTLF